MKKIEFLRLVCTELARMGVGEDEIKIQCRNIDRYLTSMGVGEESPALDSENPAAFAKLICGNIAKKQSVQPAPAAQLAVEEKLAPAEESAPEFSDEMPSLDTIETPAEPEVPVVQATPATLVVEEEPDDVKIFGVDPVPTNEDAYAEAESQIPVREEIPKYEGRKTEVPNELYNPFEEEEVTVPETINGTIEFDVSSIKKKSKPAKPAPLEEEEDYFEKADDEDYKPSGNPALFWVLVCLTFFLWIPLAALLFVGIGLGIVLMVLFEALYIPGLVAIIIGGSAVSFAELIYSIIKFAGKNPAVAFFELGLGFLVAALTVGLPAGMYYLGVGVFPKWIKNYGRNIKKLMKKLRRVYRKLKGACSI